MNLQSGLKLLAISVAAICWVGQASANAPSKDSSGEVFGFSFITDGVNSALEVIRNAFADGIHDARDSGTAVLSNVSVGQVVTQAPEIDPASALSALTLLAGGLAVIRGRKPGA